MSRDIEAEQARGGPAPLVNRFRVEIASGIARLGFMEDGRFRAAVTMSIANVKLLSDLIERCLEQAKAPPAPMN